MQLFIENPSQSYRASPAIVFLTTDTGVRAPPQPSQINRYSIYLP